MTHVFIDYFVRRAQALREHITASPAPAPAPSSSSSSTRSSRPLSSVMPRQGERCVFCSIVDGSEPAVKVYEDAHVMAFFDIYPIRSGHTLVVPREHHELVSDLPDELGAAIGITLPRMARAIARATGQPAFNVVSNSGHGQVVPHVHFHIVSAPGTPSGVDAAALEASGKATKKDSWITAFGREELDFDEAEPLAQRIRDALREEAEGRR